jgi:gamma-glutamylputrescine oxidase
MSDIDTTAYGGSWYAATMVDAPPRPALTSDLDVEVCVIGGGLAGLTTARELARRGWSVVLLEADRIAANASGRNTGFVLPGFAAEADSLIARVGFDRAKDLWALSQAGLDYVRNAVRSEGMTGIDPRDGWLYVSKVDNGEEFLHLVGLLGELGCEIEGWPTERVRAVLRSERYFHAIHYLRAITIHPLNYALGLAAAAERDGARIFEHTPALSIDPAGVRKRIVTPSARLRANHVVLCGNVQLGTLMPRVATTLVPVTTYVITTAPLGPRLGEAIGYQGAVSDTELADNHYRIVGGDRLMVSGRATTWARNPRRYVPALTADIKKTYPQLGNVEVDYAWSGTLGNTVHRMPQIGELGPGVWLASGFGGHGLNTTAMAGNIIARAIVDGDETWRQFTPFELVWAGGTLGRAAVQMRVWIKRLRDAIAERHARAAAHRREHEAASLLDSEQTHISRKEHDAAEPDVLVEKDLAQEDLAQEGLAQEGLAQEGLAQEGLAQHEAAPAPPRTRDPESIVPAADGTDGGSAPETSPPLSASGSRSRRRRRRETART